MLSYHFLLDLAIILAFTKVLGILTKKIHMPQVVGALMAGLILGPAFLNAIDDVSFVKKIAEIGVIVLIFRAGLETNLNELKKCGFASIIIALCGIIIPLAGGFGIAYIFNNNGSFADIDKTLLLENILVGIILTATSVSITVETLRELGRLNTRSGTAILGAALIDDIIGIVILAIVTSSAGSDSNVIFIIFRIALFFVLAVAIGFPFYYFFNNYSKTHRAKRRFSVISLAFCLLMAFVAEHFFYVADIIGAFITGVVISNTVHAHFISRRVEITSYMLLSPVFFASIGLGVSKTDFGPQMLLLSFLLVLVAIITKIVGCGLGAHFTGYSKDQSLKIGVGMVSRGEVALIMANKGISLGLLKSIFLGPIIFMVMTTSILTPILLNFIYKRNKEIECIDDYLPSTHDQHADDII